MLEHATVVQPIINKFQQIMLNYKSLVFYVLQRILFFNVDRFKRLVNFLYVLDLENN